MPDLRQLGLFHDDLTVSRGLLQPWTTLPSVATVVFLVWGALHWRRRWPLLCFGILWFFAGHLLESTILPLELVFEHRNYLPSFGIILGCVGAVYQACGDAPQRRLIRFGLAGCIGLMALTTAMRAYDWRSELSFARSEAQHHPGSARAQSEVQWAYMAYIIASGDVTPVPQAVAAAEHSKALDPGSINQDVGLAYMFAMLKDTPQAQDYLTSAAQRAREARATSTLQLALQSLLQLTPPEHAALHGGIRSIFDAVLANPAMAVNDCYHAEIWNTYGLFLEGTGEIPRAAEKLHKAVSLCPGNALIRVNYAGMLIRFGDLKDAKQQLDALRDLHDLRHGAELQRLRAEYDAQLRPQTGS
jgi:Flp pilus assembly protein TadD